MRLALVEAAAKLAPRYEAIRANPFPPKVQAWIHEFQTARPYTIEKLNARIFSAPLRVDLMHRAVIWQRDGMRQGTHSTKGISDIRGTTRKAAPQKGGGRARVGTYRAPQFRGGATVFGPQPRDHSTKLQHKVQLAALRSALSTKYMQDELILVDALQLNTHKTREFVDLIQRHNWSNRSVLLTTGRADIDKNLTAASKNLQAVTCTLADDLDVYRMLQNDLLVLDRTAVRALESKLQVD
ncbi:50S ribosomal protein L4 [Syncephalis fuscata]|nr:50S ribosomal protein L4 [Syncephalis fuscata]